MSTIQESIFTRIPNIKTGDFKSAQVTESYRKELKATIQSINNQKAKLGDNLELLLALRKISPISPQNNVQQLMLKNQQSRLNQPDPEKLNPKKAAKIRNQLIKAQLAQLTHSREA